MSVVTKSVNIVSSVDNVLALVISAVNDVKVGKSIPQVVADLVPMLVTAFTNLGDLKQDLLDRKDLETTVALKVSELVNVFIK